MAHGQPIAHGAECIARQVAEVGPAASDEGSTDSAPFGFIDLWCMRGVNVRRDRTRFQDSPKDDELVTGIEIKRELVEVGPPPSCKQFLTADEADYYREALMSERSKTAVAFNGEVYESRCSLCEH